MMDDERWDGDALEAWASLCDRHARIGRALGRGVADALLQRSMAVLPPDRDPDVEGRTHLSCQDLKCVRSAHDALLETLAPESPPEHWLIPPEETMPLGQEASALALGLAEAETELELIGCLQGLPLPAGLASVSLVRTDPGHADPQEGDASITALLGNPGRPAEVLRTPEDGESTTVIRARIPWAQAGCAPSFLILLAGRAGSAEESRLVGWLGALLSAAVARCCVPRLHPLALDELETAIAAARRRRRILTLLAVGCPFLAAARRKLGDEVEREILVVLEEGLSQAKRSSDRAWVLGEGVMGVLLDEASAETAMTAAHRLAGVLAAKTLAVTGAQLQLEVRIGGAVLRAGETAQRLIARALANLERAGHDSPIIG